MMTRTFCAFALVGGVAMSAAAQQEYHRQDPVQTFGGLSSQDARNPGGLGWFSEVADNFAGQSGWSIDQVEFWGGYATAPGSPGNTQGFTVRFYTDAGGTPGTRVYEQDVMLFGEVEYAVVSGLAGYHYMLQLPTPFEITTAGEYWVSIVAILDRGGGSNEPQWGWAASSGFNAPDAKQWFFSPGNFGPTGGDVAFVLANEDDDCPADFDASGDLTLADFVAFRNAYVAGDLAADFDQSGTLTLADFVAFRNAYVAGCP